MIALDKFDRAHYAALISWIDSEEMLMQFGGPLFSYPLTNAQLDVSLSDPQRMAFCITLIDTGEVIGHAEIYFSEQSAKLARILIGDPEQRGKGLGQRVMQLLLDRAFGRPEIEVVELNVFDFNTGAIKCYEKVGFVINPAKKLERQVKGETWTAINMTIDRVQWKPL